MLEPPFGGESPKKQDSRSFKLARPSLKGVGQSVPLFQQFKDKSSKIHHQNSSSVSSSTKNSNRESMVGGTRNAKGNGSKGANATTIGQAKEDNPFSVI